MKTEESENLKLAIDQFITDLRTATGPMHKALEANEVSKRLLQDDVTLRDYASYLEAMKGVVKWFDDQLIPAVLPVLPDAEGRKKQQDIENDLKALYSLVEPVKGGQEFIGNCSGHPTAYLMGYFYVIEGSTLGGRVILKHLNERLSLTKETTQFFNGYGEETSSRWKAFMQAFAGFIIANNAQEEAINGAIAGFTDIGNHLKVQG